MAKNLFAWASISENGTVNGVRGDQTKNEVKTGYYYDFGQRSCIRMKSIKKRRKMANIAKYLANDNRIGYSQADRTDLFKQCKKLNWNFEDVKKNLTKTNCDCSQFYAVCVNLAYGKEILTSSAYTGNLLTMCGAKKKIFKILDIQTAEKSFKKGDAPIKEYKHIIINV